MHGWCCTEKTFGNFWKYRNTFLICQCSLEMVSAQSTIKVLENTHIQNWRLNIEAVAKMGDCSTVYQYKTEEAKNI